MKKANIIRATVGLVALMAASGLVVSGAMASGTDGGGAGYGSSSGFGQYPSTNSFDEFAEGRYIYKRQLACKKCAYPGGIKSQEQADEAIGRINSGEIVMPQDKKDAVVSFLQNRFASKDKKKG
jgi:hypothetical protein